MVEKVAIHFPHNNSLFSKRILKFYSEGALRIFIHVRQLEIFFTMDDLFNENLLHAF